MSMGSDPPLALCSPRSVRGVWALRDTPERFLLSTARKKPAAAQHVKANTPTSFVGPVKC